MDKFAHKKLYVDGWNATKRTMKLRDYLELASTVFGPPVPAERTLRAWKDSVDKQSATTSSSSLKTMRRFGDENIDKTNETTYANFDFCCQNLKAQATVGSKSVASKPDSCLFNLQQELLTLESLGQMQYSLSTLAGFNLPETWRFSLDVIPSRFTDFATVKSIVSGKLPDYKMEETRCHTARKDGAAVVVAWPAQVHGHGKELLWNYGCIQQMTHTNEDMVWLAKHESILHQAVPTYSTHGPRVGAHQVSPKEHDNLLGGNWFKKCTQTNRQCMHKGKTINPHIVCNSVVTGETMRPRLPQRRCIGMRRDIKEVERMLCDYPEHRRIRLAEQKSRLCFQIFVCTYQINNEEGVNHCTLSNSNGKGILRQVNECLASFHSRKDEHMNFWQQNAEQQLTEMEVFLLECICKTGTVTQMDQLGCHCDKSEGHEIESCCLVQKADPDDNRTATEIMDDAESNLGGQTMMPLQDRAFQYRPARDVAHFNLSGTPHIGDSSRGTTDMHSGSHSHKTRKRANRAS